METKICSMCKKEKPKSAFSKRPDRASGVRSRCNECEKKTRDNNKDYHKKQAAKYYRENKERIDKKNTLWAKNNPDKIRKHKRKYYDKNIEKIKKYDHDRRKKNYPEQRETLLKKHKEWVSKNKEVHYRKMYEAKKERLKYDVEYKTKERIRDLFSSCMKKKMVKKSNNRFSYTGISMDEYIEHFKRDVNWNHYLAGGYHIDHIIPNSLFDYGDKNEIKKCWNPRNLRLIPASENISKGDVLDMGLVLKCGIEDLLPKELVDG